MASEGTDEEDSNIRQSDLEFDEGGDKSTMIINDEDDAYEVMIKSKLLKVQ